MNIVIEQVVVTLGDGSKVYNVMIHSPGFADQGILFSAATERDADLMMEKLQSAINGHSNDLAVLR